MKTRAIAALLLATAATLTACSSSSSDGSNPEPKATASAKAKPDSIAERNKNRKAAGLPLYPTGQKRSGYIKALRGIDDWFVDDKGEFDAVENGVDQCSGVDGDRAIWSAQQRFGKDGPDGRKVTEAEAQQINKIVVKYICPDKG
ncbi:hypothetical protein [Streptomyces sp. NPDC002952]|uniref:hypothetical protein n=1 Tax=Streptomyces sp. NPDC002952 TaxID=3364673 RepID=UPI00367FEFCC